MNLFGAKIKQLTLEETAFGLSRETLNLTGNETDSDSLKNQIAAYSDWLKTKLSGLQGNPKSNKEKLSWLWEIAKLHRTAEVGTNNNRILFVRELVQILNHGFTWKNHETKEVITLKKAVPSISLRDFSQTLKTQRAKIFSAIRLRFVNGGVFGPEQIPTGIEIVHCPLTLSACLELQGTEVTDRRTVLQAHYLIPENDKIFDFPIQLRDHEKALRRTSAGGELEYSSKVVLMLVGRAGRLREKQTLGAIPDWFTSWQLERMAEVVGDICEKLAILQPEDKQGYWRRCVTINEGLHFQRQNASHPLWGRISSFDQIFSMPTFKSLTA